jgi:hypothetical protein
MQCEAVEEWRSYERAHLPVRYPPIQLRLTSLRSASLRILPPQGGKDILFRLRQWEKARARGSAWMAEASLAMMAEPSVPLRSLKDRERASAQFEA